VIVAQLLTILLVQLTGPDNQKIEINPREVVSIRAPRVQEYFTQGIKCLIHTSDGKFVAVMEDCETVRIRLGEENQE